MDVTEIALQLTLKALDRMDVGRYSNSIDSAGPDIAQLFNSIREGLKLTDALTPEERKEAGERLDAALSQAELNRRMKELDD